jgi:hypothetical protein
MASENETCLSRLAEQERLLNPVVHAQSQTVPGRQLFRGELAVKFAPVTEREKKPPELKVEQVLMAADAGKPTLPFFAGYLLSFESLLPLSEVLAEMLSKEGKYFVFCGNIDLGSSYQVTLGEATFYVLPLDESTVYNELLELLRIEKNDLKKRDSAGKIEAIVVAVLKFTRRFESISYERGLELMGPVKNPGEHRPV